MNLNRLILLVPLLLLSGCSTWSTLEYNQGVAPGRGFVTRTDPVSGRQYMVFVPHNYSPSKQYMTVLFLHGLFEGGNNPEKAVLVGLGPSVAERSRTLECIVVFPQARNNWRNEEDQRHAVAILQDVRRNYSVDNDRIVLTGLSDGGYGVWAVASLYPDQFAALVPMCGYDKLDAVPRIRHLPTWIFHNTGDPFVSVGDSRAMRDALQKAGGRVSLTEFGTMGHNCWTRAYKMNELWAWMGQQRRPGSLARR